MAEVEISRDGSVLTITLNRPDVLNAFTAELHKQLVGAFKEARDPEVRAVVVTGAGRGFCVGQDLNELGEAAKDIAGRLRTNYHPTIRSVRGLEKPTGGRNNFGLTPAARAMVRSVGRGSRGSAGGGMAAGVHSGDYDAGAARNATASFAFVTRS